MIVFVVTVLVSDLFDFWYSRHCGSTRVDGEGESSNKLRYEPDERRLNTRGHGMWSDAADDPCRCTVWHPVALSGGAPPLFYSVTVFVAEREGLTFNVSTRNHHNSGEWQFIYCKRRPKS